MLIDSTNKKARNIFFIINSLITIFVVTLFSIEIQLLDLSAYKESFLWILRFIFVYTIITALIFNRNTSLYAIFLFCYFLFCLGRLFIPYDNNNLNILHTVLQPYIIDDHTLSVAILYNIFIIAIIHFGFSVSLYIPDAKYTRSPLNFNPTLFHNARLLFWAMLPFCIIKFIFEINTITQYGYTTYYTIGTNAPFFINLSRFIFEISFLLILSSMPSLKKYLLYTFIFMSAMSLFLVTGVRSKFILYFIFTFWFYYRFYSQKDLSILKISLIIIVLISCLLLSQLYRQNWVFSSDLNYFEYFFTSQGVSFYILPLTIKYINEFTNFIPSIFSPFFIDSVIYSSQDINRLTSVQLLGDIISHAALGKYYFEGHGIGGSFIAELYQAGIILSLFLSFSLGLFINYFDKFVIYNRLLLAISFYFVSNIAYMPRSSFFKSPFMVLFYLIIFFIMIKMPKIKLTAK